MANGGGIVGGSSWVATAAALIVAMGSAASAAAEPLVIREQGSFFVAGAPVRLENPSADIAGPPGRAAPNTPGAWTAGQAYVSYQIPDRRRLIQGRPAPAVILLHGCCLTGKTWETTPDGREGWATYFVRQGFPVYVVDQVGRGRSGFNPAKLNDARMSGGRSIAPPARAKTEESTWETFRIGPRPGQLYPGAKFPIEGKDQFFAQIVPDMNDWADGDPYRPSVEAMVALAARIGPAILVVHSQSSRMGWRIVEARPDRVLALIQIEGDCSPDAAQLASVWRRVPVISVWGGYITPENWGDREDACRRTMSDIARAGGSGTFLKLDEVGLPGHGHMLMQDHGNLDIADRLIAWIRRVLG